jgi:hypothetical protein
MTYGDLKSQVAAYLHRTNLTAQIINFVEYGRINFSDTLRVGEMVAKQTVTLTNSEGALSQDMVELIEVLDGTKPIPLMTLAWSRDGAWGYSIQGQTIVSGTTPLEVIHYARPLTFVGSADSATRTVLDAYPQIWIQAALKEGFRFLDDERNEAKADARLRDLITEANRRHRNVQHHRLFADNTFSNITCQDSRL